MLIKFILFFLVIQSPTFLHPLSPSHSFCTKKIGYNPKNPKYLSLLKEDKTLSLLYENSQKYLGYQSCSVVKKSEQNSAIKKIQEGQAITHPKDLPILYQKHPGCLPVYSCCSIPLPKKRFILYYQMPLIKDLNSQIKTMSDEEKKQTIVKIALTLLHLQEECIAHNDLYINNLGFNEQIQSPVLFDFDLSINFSLLQNQILSFDDMKKLNFFIGSLDTQNFFDLCFDFFYFSKKKNLIQWKKIQKNRQMKILEKQKQSKEYEGSQIKYKTQKEKLQFILQTLDCYEKKIFNTLSTYDMRENFGKKICTVEEMLPQAIKKISESLKTSSKHPNDSFKYYKKIINQMSDLNKQVIRTLMKTQKEDKEAFTKKMKRLKVQFDSIVIKKSYPSKLIKIFHFCKNIFSSLTSKPYKEILVIRKLLKLEIKQEKLSKKPRFDSDDMKEFFREESESLIQLLNNPFFHQQCILEDPVVIDMLSRLKCRARIFQNFHAMKKYS